MCAETCRIGVAHHGHGDRTTLQGLCGRLEFLWILDSQANYTGSLDMADNGFQKSPSFSATVVADYVAGHESTSDLGQEDEEVGVERNSFRSLARGTE